MLNASLTFHLRGHQEASHVGNPEEKHPGKTQTRWASTVLLERILDLQCGRLLDHMSICFPTMQISHHVNKMLKELGLSGAIAAILHPLYLRVLCSTSWRSAISGVPVRFLLWGCKTPVGEATDRWIS